MQQCESPTAKQWVLHPEALESARELWHKAQQRPPRMAFPRGTHLSKRLLVVARVRTFSGWVMTGPPSEGLRQHLCPGGMVSSHQKSSKVDAGQYGIDRATAAWRHETGKRGDAPEAVQDFLVGFSRQRSALRPPRWSPQIPSMLTSGQCVQGPSEKALSKGLRSGQLVGIPLRLWPCQSRQLPALLHRVPGVEGQLPSLGAYIQIFMVGKRAGGVGGPPEASFRRKGKGALGVVTKGPFHPESTHSQWHWMNSI